MRRKLFQLLTTAALSACMVSFASAAAPEHVSVYGYDSEVDYYGEMLKCAVDGSVYALQVGAIYEQQRNLKIERLNLEHDRTNYFTTYDTGEEILSAMKADRLKDEYYVAGTVYEYLSGHGWPDVTIAGVLGNMMAECGGQTLDLQWDIYGGGGGYYGLCQWSLFFGPEVAGRSVTGQLNYMLGNLAKNMKQFGGDYERFLALKDAGQAARYFCTYYERGSGAGVRARNAARALAWIGE